MSESQSQQSRDDRVHAEHLAHHFATPTQQRESGKLGMWLFLATEVLLFGGLFCAYAVFRANHPEIFVYAHRYLDKTLGGVNTIILICSSLTMAWGVHAAQRGQQRRLVAMLALTLVFACGFLGIKYVEYEHKWKHGLLWGKRFQPTGLHEQSPDQSAEVHSLAAEPADARPSVAMSEGRSAIPPPAPGPAGLADADEQTEYPPGRPPNVHIFFGVYFLMTGLHGLHVIGGMIAIAWILVLSTRGRFSGAYFTPVDLVGLYWHLVDMIWIYLFPLLYLIH